MPNKFISTLPNLYAHWTEVFEDAQSFTKVSGNLVEQASELPAHIGYYGEVQREIYNVRKRCDALVKRKRGELFRFYGGPTYPQALSSRDVEQYINSDDEYCLLNGHLHDIMYHEGKFDSLMEALSSKNWMIGHVTKLYVAGYEEVEI